MTTAKILAFDDHPKRHTTVCRMSQGETTQAQRAMMTRAIFTLAMQGARAKAKESFKGKDKTG